MEYEAREKAIRDYNQLMYEAEERGVQRGTEQGMQEGIKQGLQQGKFEIAAKLYSQGWKLEDISKIVDISTEILKEKVVEL